MNILNEIAAKTKERIQKEKLEIPEKDLIQMIQKRKVQILLHPEQQSITSRTPHSFYQALKKEGMSYICEVKKASPSKGIIAEEFPYLQIAKEYNEAGADAISCLTEPKYFLGKDEYLKEIAKEVKIPVLRKDFVVDEYQIYEAKILGASAVLLICAILEEEQLKVYLQIAKELGLSALVEAHDEKEIKQAVRAGAKIIGVNNRNLKDFSVNVGNSTNLRNFVPPEILFVAESGIKGPEEIKALRENKVDAVLIGETMMRSPNKAKMLRFLKGEEHHEES